MDNTVEKVGDKYEVSGFPTVLLFNEGKKTAYEGGRTVRRPPARTAACPPARTAACPHGRRARSLHSPAPPARPTWACSLPFGRPCGVCASSSCAPTPRLCLVPSLLLQAKEMAIALFKLAKKSKKIKKSEAVSPPLPQ